MSVAIVRMGAVVDDAIEIEVQVVEFRDLVLLDELRGEGVTLTVEIRTGRGELGLLTRCSGRTTYAVSFEQTRALSCAPWGYLEGSVSMLCKTKQGADPHPSFNERGRNTSRLICVSVGGRRRRGGAGLWEAPLVTALGSPC